ncbi:MAG: hypothetical protein GX601_05605 [Anaerolineales bacterium]|nr:hypothetical protein [Anaerolineales bacterium]
MIRIRGEDRFERFADSAYDEFRHDFANVIEEAGDGADIEVSPYRGRVSVELVARSGEVLASADYDFYDAAAEFSGGYGWGWGI